MEGKKERKKERKSTINMKQADGGLERLRERERERR
jgi:hypothetical protein